MAKQWPSYTFASTFASSISTLLLARHRHLFLKFTHRYVLSNKMALGHPSCHSFIHHPDAPFSAALLTSATQLSSWPSLPYVTRITWNVLKAQTDEVVHQRDERFSGG